MRDRLLVVQEGLHRREGPRLGHGRRSLPHGGAGRSRQARIPDCPRARDDGGGAPARQRRQGLRSARAARRRAPRVPSRQRVRSEQPTACGSCHGCRPADCGADRSEPPAPQDRRDARAGAPGDARADAQPHLARAARPALHGQRPRPAQVHRGRHRHQHHLHRRLPRSAAVPDPDLRRHARAGTAAGAVGERAVLQGAERAHHSRRPRHRAEPEPVRGDGRADLLPLARRSPGGRATAERGDARARRADGARLLREQDPELDHGPRVGAAGGDHGAARRGQRPAAGRDHPRRADPRGEPGPREAVRARPERVFHHRRLFSRGQAYARARELAGRSARRRSI